MSTPFEIFRIPVTIYRQLPGAYVQGNWVPNASETPIVITASIQPTTGEEMLSLPEGRRNRKAYTLFTSTDVNVITPPSINPDQVSIFGERYEVYQVDIWQNRPAIFAIINHYKFIAVSMVAIP